jgi:3-oxoacyl-[acyl-carrier protein] reductase
VTHLSESQVLVHYSSNADEAEEIVAKIKSLGVQGAAVQADGADPQFGEILVSKALQAFNTDTIDIVVNNAGISEKHENTAAVPVEAWDRIFHINVRAPFLHIQAALPYMKPGGRIVNVSSVIAKLGSYMLTVYGASKAALNSVTVSLADELGQKGITVNAVAPGPIDTSSGTQDQRITDGLLKEDPTAARLYSNQHMKRKGSPQEVADVILFLSSPMSSNVTGQHIYVDGGINLP